MRSSLADISEMVTAVVGAEQFKDPSVGDWEGGWGFFWREMEGFMCPVWAVGSPGCRGGPRLPNAKVSFARKLPLNVDVQL